MTIERNMTVPADNKLFLELPRTVPSGVIANIRINIPAVAASETGSSFFQPSSKSKIEEIRQLLQKEMAINGTSAVVASSGDGWETYVRERYGQS